MPDHPIEGLLVVLAMTRSARRPQADAYAASTSGDPGSQTITDDGPSVCECALAAIPDAARAARRFTRNTLHQWELDDLIDDAILVVSELVTNAVVHGATDPFEDDGAGTSAVISLNLDLGANELPILLQLVNQTTSVMCIVHDTAGAPPHVKDGDALAETCRGLRIVAELSSAWGWTPSGPHSKFVWAVLNATRQPVDAYVLDDTIPTSPHWDRTPQPAPGHQDSTSRPSRRETTTSTAMPSRAR